MIPVKKYRAIIDILPILCVDVIIVNQRGEYLLVKRANEPLKGRYWVVGGRVCKGETMQEAAIRKVHEEVGLKVKRLRLSGYYEEIFRENPFGLGSGVHTVSIVFTTIVEGAKPIRLDSQSTHWKYAKELPFDFRFKLFEGEETLPMHSRQSKRNAANQTSLGRGCKIRKRC